MCAWWLCSVTGVTHCSHPSLLDPTLLEQLQRKRVMKHSTPATLFSVFTWAARFGLVVGCAHAFAVSLWLCLVIVWHFHLSTENVQKDQKPTVCTQISEITIAMRTKIWMIYVPSLSHTFDSFMLFISADRERSGMCRFKTALCFWMAHSETTACSPQTLSPLNISHKLVFLRASVLALTSLTMWGSGKEARVMSTESQKNYRIFSHSHFCSHVFENMTGFLIYWHFKSQF